MLFALQHQTSSSASQQPAQANNHITKVNNTGTNQMTITIAIGSSHQTYSIDQLKHLTFFNALLSDRWLSNTDITKPIQILPINSNNNESTFMHQFVLNSKQFNFNCDDLSLLLQCLKQNQIPCHLLKPQLDKIESLLYCNDFLNPTSSNSNDNDSKDSKHKNILTSKVLIKYFRQCKNQSLNKETLQSFMNNCTHPMLKYVLNQLNNEYTKALKNAQIQVAKLVPSLDYTKLKNISFKTNEAFANTLFETRFSVYTSIEQTPTVSWVEFMHSSNPDNKRLVPDPRTQKLVICVITPSFQDKVVNNHHLPPATKVTKLKNNTNINDDINSVFNDNITINYDDDNKWDSGMVYSQDNMVNERDFTPLAQVWYFGKCFKNISNSTLKIIDNTIKEILTKERSICYIDCSIFDVDILNDIFESIAAGIMDNEIDNTSSKFNDTTYVGDVKYLLIATLTLLERITQRACWCHTGKFCRMIEYICSEENRCESYSPSDQVLRVLCRFTKDYFNGVVFGMDERVMDPNRYSAQNNLDYLRKCKLASVAWIRMIKCCLQYCSSKWLQNINNTRLWFQILHLQFRRALTLAVSYAQKSAHFVDQLRDVNVSVVGGNASIASVVNNSVDNNAHSVNNANSIEIDDDVKNNDNSSNSDHEITKYDQKMIDEIIDLKDRFEDGFAKWILDNVVSKFPQQSKFNFGIYLSEFAVFEDKEACSDGCNQRYFPKVYVDFMKQQCGIDWCITNEFKGI